MEGALVDIVFNRLLEDGTLADEVRELVLAACEGADSLAASMTGKASSRLAEARGADAADAEPAGAYLRSITVEGFRGVGPSTTLELEAGPGLTLVVGRNGSGKSSFAEAVELLLTGDNWRWKGRSVVWTEGWRNLHHASTTAISAELAVEGEPGPTLVRRQWEAGADLAGSTVWVQPRGEQRAPITSLGWSAALDTYRPFLSYNELGSMLDEGPSKLYDAISSVLGLEELIAAERLLRDARLAREREVKDVKARFWPLLASLRDSGDERAVRCHEALSGKTWDLSTVEDVLAGGVEAGATESDIAVLRQLCSLEGPDPEHVRSAADELRASAAEVDEVAGTDAGRARELAGVLQQALEFHAGHGDQPCPVCGAGELNPAWREMAEAQVRALGAEAAQADRAHRRLQTAITNGKALLVAPPAVLGRAGEVGVDARSVVKAWPALTDSGSGSDAEVLAVRLERLPEIRAALEEVVAVAKQELERREDVWRPLARDLSGWVQAARSSEKSAGLLKNLKAAEDWLKKAASRIRDERFTPIAGQAQAFWEVLRQQSNVNLDTIKLQGTGTSRRVRLSVTVDGVGGAALGVMSQGELHCLALSLFLPRATMAESPFRFVVIDDPVQAMDPARVDGLARVLSQVASGRQVVVFTHDDRLPESIRRLGLSARVIEVTRGERSLVRLRPALTPAQRAIDDALALAKTDELPAVVSQRVVPLFCRLALEAACTEVVRRRRIGRGERHAEVEDLLLGTVKLAPRLALAVFDDAGRAGEVPDALQRRFGRSKREVYSRVSRGVHGGDEGDLVGLVRNCEALANALLKLS